MKKRYFISILFVLLFSNSLSAEVCSISDSNNKLWKTIYTNITNDTVYQKRFYNSDLAGCNKVRIRLKSGDLLGDVSLRINVSSSLSPAATIVATPSESGQEICSGEIPLTKRYVLLTSFSSPNYKDFRQISLECID